MEEKLDTETEKLIILNLKYKNRGRALNRYVFADFSLKALFQIARSKQKKDREKLVLLADIYNMISKLLGLKNLPRGTVKEALSLLEQDKKIIGSNSAGWRLTSSVYEDIQKKLSNEGGFVDDIIKRHFPRDIKIAVLRRWFYDASAQLFSKFGDTVVANISGGGSSKFEQFNLAQIISKTTKKYTLDNKKQALFRGYENFISSQDHNDQKLLADLAIRWFGARLVVANVGNDPITLDEIKGSKFILDTNVLIAITLGRRPFAKSIEALSNALNEVEAELVYLSITREEYVNVADYQCDQILKLIRSYGVEKIKELELREDFIKAALRAGCKNEDDFNKFFQEVREIPEELRNGPKIKLDEDEKIVEYIESARKDTALLKLLKTTKVEHTGKEPSDNSQKHDAALIRVAEFLSNEEERKVWALSFDNSLKHVGIKASGDDIPKVMGVETLIEFLALSGAGSKLSNSDFAPLLANILKNHCLPYGGSRIRMSDLFHLQATVENAPNLPAENIRRMSQVIAKARIENKPVEDTEVQAELISLENKEFEKLDKKLEKAERRANEAHSKRQAAETQARKKQRQLENLEITAIQERTKNIKRTVTEDFIKAIIVRLLAIGVIYLAIFFLADKVIESNISAVQLLGGLVAVAGYAKWILNPVQTYRRKIKIAAETAEVQIKEAHKVKTGM